jgi:PAS domain S-box-containing protein
LRLVELTTQIASIAIERHRAEQALRRSEESLRALTDNISPLSWMADEKGWIFWYSQRWFEYTGTTHKEMEGWGWQKVHHPDHVQRVTEKIRLCFKTGEEWHDTFPLRGKDGNYRWFLSCAIPMKDARGKTWRWVGTNTDVTELRDTQEALLKAQEQLRRDAAELENRVAERTAQLQASLTTVENYNYTIAHDLRSPLRGMLGFADALLEDYDQQFDPTGKEYLRRIKAGARRMDDLVSDLLEYGQLAHLDLALESVDVEVAIRQALEDVAPEIETSQAQIDVRHPLPTVHANAVVLRQVLANLISNAVKFVAKGTIPRVTIRADEKANRARIWIEDSGLGIEPEYHRKIFEMFQRLNPRELYSGTGIGLAIVSKGIERMKGTCGVESEPGKGSRFWIELPKA